MPLFLMVVGAIGVLWRMWRRWRWLREGTQARADQERRFLADIEARRERRKAWVADPGRDRGDEGAAVRAAKAADARRRAKLRIEAAAARPHTTKPAARPRSLESYRRAARS